MSVRVVFGYDEDCRKWDPLVTGDVSHLEARQAFAAVVLTCKMLNEDLLGYSLVEKIEHGYKITPAV